MSSSQFRVDVVRVVLVVQLHDVRHVPADGDVGQVQGEAAHAPGVAAAATETC